jgi:pimeloyl-ACP methyl ester carboxylesterase
MRNFFRVICLLGVFVVSARSVALAQELEPGVPVKLGANEGLAVFSIDVSFPLKRITLDRKGSVFSFPRIEDLQRGRYIRVLRLPVGEYEFAKFEAGYYFWQFDDVRNAKFRVEAGHLNYVGEVDSELNFLTMSLSVDNAGMYARDALERNYPGLLEQFPWRYAGQTPDPFLDGTAQNRDAKVENFESTAQPDIADRDAAEIMFRGYTQAAGPLSPDGRFVLETTLEGQNIAVKVVDLDQQKSRVVYSGVELNKLQWVDHEVLALRTAGTNSTSKLIRIRSTDDVVELALAKGQIVGVVPSEGKVVLKLPTEKVRLVHADVRGALDRKAIDRLPVIKSGQFHAWWLDRFGAVRLVAFQHRGRSTPKSRRYQYFAVDGTVSEFVIKNEKNLVHMIVGFDAEQRILALSNKDRDVVELVELDPATGQIARTVLAIPNTDLYSVIDGINDEIRAVRFLQNGRLVEKSLDQDDNFSKRLASSFPGQNVLLKQSAANGRRLVYLDGPTNPGMSYIYEPKSKGLELLNSSAPHLEGRPLAASERFVVKANDGFEIEVFLTRSKTQPGKKQPLIVLPHGGPIGVFDFQRFDPEVQYFSMLGFAVLQVNFRGSGGSGKAKEALGIKQWGTSMVEDIDRAVDEALKRHPLDASRIAALGTSYGGYAAVRLAQVNPKRYRAVVGICGVYDLPLLFSAGASSRTERSIEWFSEHVGDPSSELALLQAQSPVYADKLISPMLLVHDRGDVVAPFEHALRMLQQAALRQAPVNLITTNDEQHGLVNAGTAIATYPKIAEFLRRTLAFEREAQ